MIFIHVPRKIEVNPLITCWVIVFFKQGTCLLFTMLLLRIAGNGLFKDI